MADDQCIICLDTQNVACKNLVCSCKVYIHESCYEFWSAAHPSECPICRKSTHVAINVEPERPVIVIRSLRVSAPGRREKLIQAFILLCACITAISIMLLIISI